MEGSSRHTLGVVSKDMPVLGVMRRAGSNTGQLHAVGKKKHLINDSITKQCNASKLKLLKN